MEKLLPNMCWQREVRYLLLATLALASGCTESESRAPGKAVSSPKQSPAGRPSPAGTSTSDSDGAPKSRLWHSPGWEAKAPDGARFGFFQRYRKDNQWDSGKEIPAPIGREILALLSGAEKWNPEEAPEHAVAWGLHAHAPMFVAALEIHPADYDGRPTLDSFPRHSFCYGCGLFLPDQGSYYVVPHKNKEALLKALNALTDPDRGPLAP